MVSWTAVPSCGVGATVTCDLQGVSQVKTAFLTILRPCLFHSLLPVCTVGFTDLITYQVIGKDHCIKGMSQ